MALPSITVNISGDSFQTTSGEAVGSFVAGAVVSGTTLINALGTTAEVNQQHLTIDSLDNLWSRLNLVTDNGSGMVFDGAPGSSRWPFGPTGDWKTNFYKLETACSYGSIVILGVTQSEPFITNQIQVNAIFDCDGDSDSELSTILGNRDNDCLVLREIESKGDTADILESNYVYVYGKKQIIPNGSDIETESQNPIYIPLTVDTIGCMARTFRIAKPWYSPAGFTRGTIRNVYRLVDPPTGSESQTLYNNNINIVVSFPNQGIVLFGDKTGGEEKIGQKNLLLYLQEEIGKIARQSLFEINNEQTRTLFTLRANSALEAIKNQFGITEYRIICDSTNNTPEVVASGDFIAQVTYKPINSIKSVTITFTSIGEDQIIQSEE